MKLFFKACLYLTLKILLPSLLIIGSVILNYVYYATIEAAGLVFLGVLWWFLIFIPEVLFIIMVSSHLISDGVLNVFVGIFDKDPYLQIEKVDDKTYKIESKEPDNSFAVLLMALLGLIASCLSIFLFIFGIIRIIVNKKLCYLYANTLSDEITNFKYNVKDTKIIIIIATSIFVIILITTIIVTSIYKVDIFNSKNNEKYNINYGSQYIRAEVVEKNKEEIQSQFGNVSYPFSLKFNIYNGCKKNIDYLNFNIVIYKSSTNEKLLSDEISCADTIISEKDRNFIIYIDNIDKYIYNYELCDLKITFKINYALFGQEKIIYQHQDYIAIGSTN